MALVRSDWATGVKPMPYIDGNEVVNVLLKLPVTAAQTASGDIYEMGYLPEYTTLVDAVISMTDVDTNGSPAHAMSFGIIKDDGSDLDTTVFQTGLTVGQAGTTVRLTPSLTTLTYPVGTARKKIGFKVTTASATGAAGTVYLSLSYRGSQYGL